MRLDIVDGRLAAWHDYSAREHMKAVPGARWDPKARAWTYPLTYPSAVSIGVLATKLRVPIAPSPEATTWVQEQTEDWQALTDAGLAVSADKRQEGIDAPTIKEAGFDVVAYPADYHTNFPADAIDTFGSIPAGLKRFDESVKEWVGLAAYWLMGRTSALYPAPD